MFGNATIVSKMEDNPQIISTAMALEALGSKAAIAKALGISHQAVCRWEGWPPARRQYELRELLARDRDAVAA